MAYRGTSSTEEINSASVWKIYSKYSIAQGVHPGSDVTLINSLLSASLEKDYSPNGHNRILIFIIPVWPMYTCNLIMHSTYTCVVWYLTTISTSSIAYCVYEYNRISSCLVYTTHVHVI